MSPTTPYNPLEKKALAQSIQTEMLRRPPDRLSDVSGIEGAGVYALYYTGAFAPYGPVSAANSGGQFSQPIYVGKAIPKGGRKGGFSGNAGVGDALAQRLRAHFRSVSSAGNLEEGEFFVRHLVVDDIWIPLGENILIETFQPLWNVTVEGFGNNDPGGRRSTQYKSSWDVLHPGREWANKLATPPRTQADIIRLVKDALAT